MTHQRIIKILTLRCNILYCHVQGLGAKLEEFLSGEAVASLREEMLALTYFDPVNLDPPERVVVNGNRLVLHQLHEEPADAVVHGPVGSEVRVVAD